MNLSGPKRYSPQKYCSDSSEEEEVKKEDPLVPFQDVSEDMKEPSGLSLLKIDESIHESIVKSSLKSSSKSEKSIPTIYPKKHKRKSISDPKLRKSSHRNTNHNESSNSLGKSSFLSKTIGNYLDNKSIRDTSNYGESNPSSHDNATGYDKSRAMARIDFARQLKSNSDRSSPYMGSIYSRQAQLISPLGGYPRAYPDSSKSSNKSLDRVSPNTHSDYSKRFINQGYTIAHSSKNDSNPTDHEISVQTALNNEGRDTILSPANNFRELRKRIHEENDFRSRRLPDKVLGPSLTMQLRPLPKSFKSSNLSSKQESALKNRLGFPLTPQM
ncbi:unnamed protein product [Moneuplotes crassus]|uniref:Uncharacterized protein n=1 Tax=Euplotes crassus TaxID=5936 RepID=A0AAD1YA05_EUPCR|nr:unnamed protein product [Moneuplotes crassus]